VNSAEQRLADDLYAAMMEEVRQSTRSGQARAFRVGMSDLGFCHERVRRMLDGQTPEDTDELTSWIGTALGAHAEKSWLRVFPDAICQMEVTLEHRVPVNGRLYGMTLTGHPDLVVPDGIVIDAKTVNGLAHTERTGPEEHQEFQLHQYALACHRARKFKPEVQLDDVQVANAWIDRSGEDHRLHVSLRPFDMGWVNQATEWLTEAVYAYINREAAQKDPPRTMCEKVCGFFADCRAFDTDVTGLISDPKHLALLDQFVEGRDMEAAGKRLRSQARAGMQEFGVAGWTHEWAVRWTHINQSEAGRRGYDKLEVTAMPKQGGSS